MTIDSFKEKLKKEIQIYSKFKETTDSTPILSRLEDHINHFKLDTTLDKLLNPNNLKQDTYISFLLQTFSPGRPRYNKVITLNGKPVSGDNNRDKMLKIIKYVGLEKIKKVKTLNKYIQNIDIKNDKRFRSIGNGYFFDISFKGTGASQGGEFFIKEVNKIYPDIKIKIETIKYFKY